MSPSTARPEDQAGAGWRVAAALLGCAGYAVASHWMMVHAAGRPWAVAALFGPLVLAVAAAGWQMRQPLLLLACGAGVALLALVVARGGVHDVNRMYVLQHAGVHLALGISFGSSLRRGATPFITAIAATVHTRFGPDLRAYTRRITGVWTAYFFAMVALSCTLYALAPWPWWSFYANVATPLSALALFVLEHLLRYRRHPEFERITLRTAIGAYRRSGAAGAPRP